MSETISNSGLIANSPATLSNVNLASPDLLKSEIDKRIVKLRPMATPVDQISRHADVRHAGSMVVEYYSVDSRPGKMKIFAFEKCKADAPDGAYRVRFASGAANFLQPTETIIIPELKNTAGESVVFYVCGVDGSWSVLLPLNVDSDETLASAAGKELVRMGRAASELDVQTPQFQTIPVKSSNFCQIFKAQIEQTTFVKLANKEVGWTMSDQEESAVMDMRLGMEKNFLFGHKKRFIDPVKHEEILFTGGIWEQAKNTFTYDYNEDLSKDKFLELMRSAFTGNGGSSRKILIGGSRFIEWLHLVGDISTVRPDRIVNKWGIDFTSLHSKFGTLYVVLSEVFDQCGHNTDAIIIDPNYITKYVHIPFQTQQLNLRTSGIRNTDAIVLTEASCLVLRYPEAHTRIMHVETPKTNSEQ